jgi:hypothetical protein
VTASPQRSQKRRRLDPRQLQTDVALAAAMDFVVHHMKHEIDLPVCHRLSVQMKDADREAGMVVASASVA